MNSLILHNLNCLKAVGKGTRPRDPSICILTYSYVCISNISIFRFSSSSSSSLSSKDFQDSSQRFLNSSNRICYVYQISNCSEYFSFFLLFLLRHFLLRIFRIWDHDFWICRNKFDLDTNFRCDLRIFRFFFFFFFFTFFWRFLELGTTIFEFPVPKLILVPIFVAIWAFFVFSSLSSSSLFSKEFQDLGPRFLNSPYRNWSWYQFSLRTALHMYPFFPANFIYLAAKESQNTAHFDNISSCEVQKRGFRTFVAEIKSETLQKIDKDTPGNFLYLFAQTPYSYPFSFLSFLASYTHTINYTNI